MVREFTELQGTMGGIYARDEGLPEEVWKAIYFHYLPIGVEADAPPTRAQLGKAAVTWAAVSLADKLDTIVGLFAAGEKPTGSRDPFGLRRAAQGVVKILVDLPALTGIVTPAASIAGRCWRAPEHRSASRTDAGDEARCFDVPGASALRICSSSAASTHDERPRGDAGVDRPTSSPLETLQRARGAAGVRGSRTSSRRWRSLFKRVKNITKDVERSSGHAADGGDRSR